MFPSGNLVDDLEVPGVGTLKVTMINAGIPTIICGPGSIEQAHKADEYVELSEIVRCDRFLQKLLESCTVS